MLPAVHHDLLRKGIAAAKQGDKANARLFLMQATEVAPDDELAWLWLASVASSRTETVAFLEKALEINPDDARTRTWLERVRGEKPRSRKHWRCPICSGESIVEVDKCPSCKSVLSLKHIDRFFEAGDVDRPLLESALARLEALTGDQVTYEVHLAIAIAYLNLKRVYEGVTRLRVARQLRPTEEDLETAIGALLARQEANARALTEVMRPLPEPGVRRKILVVDDSPTVLKIVGVTLERHGHEVLVASNALQALAKLDESAPDLILLDITMPHMDGYQLCRLVRSNPALSHIPVVMLSGKDGFFDKVRGRLAGATDYITKPFEPAALVLAVEKHCQSAEPRSSTDGG